MDKERQRRWAGLMVGVLIAVSGIVGAAGDVGATERYRIRDEVSLTLKDNHWERLLKENAPGTQFMRADEDGETILPGLRKDPSRWSYTGDVKGTVISNKTDEVVGTYTFRVVRIVPGRTDRLTDAYLLCQGTYWFPAPLAADDRDWKRIPPTIASYRPDDTHEGFLFQAESEGAGRSDAGMVFSAKLQPLFFGKGFVHSREP